MERSEVVSPASGKEVPTVLERCSFSCSLDWCQIAGKTETYASICQYPGKKSNGTSSFIPVNSV